MTKAQSSTRRSMFVGAAALVATPLAMPALAAASPDAELVNMCDEAIALHESTIDPTQGDDAVTEILDRAYALMAAAISIPASTHEGLVAKARLFRIEHLLTEGEDETRLGPSERLMRSLVNDMILQDRRVPAFG